MNATQECYRQGMRQFLRKYWPKLQEPITLEDAIGHGEPIKEFLEGFIRVNDVPLLDAGSGRYPHAYLPQREKIVCVDWVSENLPSPQHINSQRFIADVEDLPFPDKYFGAVVSNGVFSYVLDPKRMLRELVRVLRPGGKFAIIGLSSPESIASLNVYTLHDFTPDVIPFIKGLGISRQLDTHCFKIYSQFEVAKDVAVRAYLMGFVGVKA